jgi:D-3-phosphoglycerate dehydrogenase
MGKIKILITDGFAKDGTELLKSIPDFDVDVRKATSVEECMAAISGADCIVVRSATKVTKELIENASSMKLIVRAGAGVDNIDVPAATAKKIPVMTTATANSLAAAEMAFSLMFSVLRNVSQAALALREGKWDREVYKGYEATGKTLGVIGLGNIGRIVAEKAIGFGMRVLAYDPMIKDASQLRGSLPSSPAFKLATTIDEAMEKSDILTIHVPKNKETANLVNAERIGKMKPKSFIINCARGGIVDEKAVLSAIDSGKLAGAGFDVYEKEPPQFPNPLFMHPKVVCTPHLGASSYEAQDRVSTTAAIQIVGFFTKGDKTGIINGV